MILNLRNNWTLKRMSPHAISTIQKLKIFLRYELTNYSPVHASCTKPLQSSLGRDQSQRSIQDNRPHDLRRLAHDVWDSNIREVTFRYQEHNSIVNEESKLRIDIRAWLAGFRALKRLRIEIPNDVYRSYPQYSNEWFDPEAVEKDIGIRRKQIEQSSTFYSTWEWEAEAGTLMDWSNLVKLWEIIGSFLVAMKT